jgi:hypothetical protein
MLRVVVIDRGEVIDLPNGTKVTVGMRTHGSAVSPTGEERSQWCTSEAHTNAAGEPTGGAGHCEAYYDNGDILWSSFLTRPGQPTRWSVMGGTGRYEGATGGGTATLVSMRSDGSAWTGKLEGTIVTK